MKKLILIIIILTNSFYILAQFSTDSNDWTFHHQTNDGWFSSICEDMNGNIIVGGGEPNSYFRVYDGNSWTLYNPSNLGVSFNFFGRAISVDNNNKIWLAPGNVDGISSWDGSTIINYTTANSDITSNSIFGIGIDNDDKLWLTNLQSFDGLIWDNLNWSGSSRNRQVFISSNNDVWISGIYSTGVETGDISQPNVYKISNNIVTSYHVNNGDILPKLSGGYHLIGELSDGTIFIVGKTNNGIEMSKFDGVDWIIWDSYTGSETNLNSGEYFALWIDENDNILIGGRKSYGISQIVKYCSGDWNFYNLPESDGFPDEIFDIRVDSNNNLWIVGITGICSTSYTPTSCELNGTKQHLCDLVYYKDDYLYIKDCEETNNIIDFKIYTLIGQTIFGGILNSNKSNVGKLKTGIYIIKLHSKNGENQITKIYVN